ncbi:MAG TPA: hypothetical protein VK881_14495 [bacterium]|nr:hypothetical protein [bacterium]
MGSLEVLVQVPLQTFGIAGGHVQPPFMQVWPPAHTVLQWPQCMGLLLVSTQVPLQQVRPLAQGQVVLQADPGSEGRHLQVLPPQTIGG